MSDAAPEPAWQRFAPYVLAAASIAWWAVYRHFTGIALEDAFITFRYAENLATGHGFAFNPGEPVLGTTTPLFTLLLAVSGFVFGAAAIPTAATVLGIVFGQVAAWTLCAALRSAGVPKPACLLAAVWVLFHSDVTWSTVGGMETALVLALMGVSLLAHTRGRDTASGVACGLLVLTRVDGLVWAGLLLALVAWRRRGGAVVPVLAFVGTLLPWLIYAWIEFGSPVPHSVTAKRVIGRGGVGGIWTGANAQEHLRWCGRALGIRGLGLFVTNAAFVAFVGLLWLGVRRIARDRPALLALALFPPTLCAAYFAGGAPRDFPWYLVPLTFCTLPVAAVGVDSAWRWRRVNVVAARSGGFATACLVTFVIAWGDLASFFWQSSLQVNETTLRRRVGEWLAAETPQDAGVAMEAVGYQGYFSRRRVIDLAGLVSPRVLDFHRGRTPAEAFDAVLQELRPDYLVLRSFEVDENRSFHGGPLFADDAARERFDASYEEAERFEAKNTKRWGELAYLTVYRRR